VWVWLGVQAGVPTVVKDDEEVVVEEDTVMEWNGRVVRCAARSGRRKSCKGVGLGCWFHW